MERPALQVLAAALWLTAAAAPLAAQQFVTDDAATMEHRACQLEAWHGERSSWVLPACAPVPDLEITAGLGRVEEHGAREAEYVLMGKYLFRSVERGPWGIGLAAGLGFGPLARIGAEGMSTAFAYVPVSAALGEAVVLHGNLGWQRERAHGPDQGPDHGHRHGRDGAHHELTWAARADLLLPLAGERLTLIGELFGEDRYLPELQLGLRAELVPDRVEMDLSWGGHTQRGERGAGWVLGIAWTPPPFP